MERLLKATFHDKGLTESLHGEVFTDNLTEPTLFLKLFSPNAYPLHSK
jgi:hypothetical protein